MHFQHDDHSPGSSWSQGGFRGHVEDMALVILIVFHVPPSPLLVFLGVQRAASGPLLPLLQTHSIDPVAVRPRSLCEES